MKITWLGQGGFLFESAGFRLVADPYISDCVGKMEGKPRLYPFPVPLPELRPDHVIVTHDHLDHLDPEGIPLIREMYPACRYTGPDRSHHHFLQLGIPDNLVSLAVQKKSFSAGPFRITPVPAFHSDPTACGYLIEAEGKRLYLSGDTLYNDSLLEESLLKGLDLMLICINGKFGNMNDAEALHCAEVLKPAMALPMHIELFADNTKDPAEFIAGCLRAGISSRRMEAGKSFVL